MNTGLKFCRAAALFAIERALAAGTVVYTFERFPHSTFVTRQYPGLTFTNTITLTAGISLNEFEFPPHSGTNVASDNRGPITITLPAPVQSFGAYFAHTRAVARDLSAPKAFVYTANTLSPVGPNR